MILLKWTDRIDGVSQGSEVLEHLESNDLILKPIHLYTHPPLTMKQECIKWSKHIAAPVSLVNKISPTNKQITRHVNTQGKTINSISSTNIPRHILHQIPPYNLIPNPLKTHILMIQFLLPSQSLPPRIPHFLPEHAPSRS